MPASTALAHLAAPRAGTPPGFVDRLLSAVARLHAPVTLVIDDFHNVPRTGVSAGIEQLLRSSSPHLRLVLSTRHDPDLPMHVFRANGELVELRAADLAFTEDEAREFLAALAVELQPGLFQALLARTEGWAAGLRLFTLSLQGGGVVDALLDESAAVDYLVQEALKSQPEETRRFLLQTSIVDRLTPDLAEALTGRDCAGTLEELVNKNLFIERVGSNPAWYRYHHLFAEILRTELFQEGPAEVAELHTRAAGWYLAHGEHVDALQHAFAAGNLDLASSCLVKSWFDLLVDADLTMQTTLTDALPADRVRDSVPLTAVAATLALMSGDVRRGGKLLDAIPRAEVAACDLRAQAMFAFACLFRHRLEGECSKAAKLAERLLELAEAGFTAGRTADRIRALALGFLGICEIWLRRPDAQSNLHEALHLARAADVAHTEIASLGGLALIELGQGRLRRASELARTAVAAAESGGLDRSAQAVHGYTILALADYEWNDLDAAEEKARTLFEVALTSGDRIARVLSAIVDASICLAHGGGAIEVGIQRLKGIEHDWRTVDAPAFEPRARPSIRASPPPPATSTRRTRSSSGPPPTPPNRGCLSPSPGYASAPESRLTRWRCSRPTARATPRSERSSARFSPRSRTGRSVTEESREATARALALGEGEEHPPAVARRRAVAAGAALGPPAALDVTPMVRLRPPVVPERERRWRGGAGRAARAADRAGSGARCTTCRRICRTQTSPGSSSSR